MMTRTGITMGGKYAGALTLLSLRLCSGLLRFLIVRFVRYKHGKLARVVLL